MVPARQSEMIVSRFDLSRLVKPDSEQRPYFERSFDPLPRSIVDKLEASRTQV